MAARKKVENEFAQVGSSKPKRTPRKKKEESIASDSFGFEQVSPAYGSGRLRAKLSLGVIATLHVGFLAGVLVIGLKNAPPSASASALELLKTPTSPRVSEDVFDELFERNVGSGATNLTQIADALSSQPLPGNEAPPAVEQNSQEESGSSGDTEPPPSAPETPESEEPEVWVVKRGDTLFGVARKMGVSVSALQSKNNLDGTKIEVGQKLLRP